MSWSPLVRSSRVSARKFCPLGSIPSFPRRPALPSLIFTKHSSRPAIRNTQLPSAFSAHSRRSFNSSSIMAGTNATTNNATASQLRQTITPALLDEIRNFWFAHFCDEDALVLPGQTEMMKWFKKDDEFDKACVTQFQPALEAILASNATASDILAAVDIEKASPLTWLSLVILLDQVPRNCYRGSESKQVFTRFDPLAQEIALRAIDAGVPEHSPIRYRLAYRFWFHLPLMHSESLEVHKRAVTVHEDMAKDMEEFLQKDIGALDGDEKVSYELLTEKKDALKAHLESTMDFEKRHLVIIERFGRYPHRNEAMGRMSTEEEIDYLENGGETFG